MPLMLVSACEEAPAIDASQCDAPVMSADSGLIRAWSELEQVLATDVIGTSRTSTSTVYGPVRVALTRQSYCVERPVLQAVSYRIDWRCSKPLSPNDVRRVFGADAATEDPFSLTDAVEDCLAVGGTLRNGVGFSCRLEGSLAVAVRCVDGGPRVTVFRSDLRALQDDIVDQASML